MDYNFRDIEQKWQKRWVENGTYRVVEDKTKKKLEIPAEWQNVKYAKDETLPVAKINKGVATIKVKMLGYKPGMHFYVAYCCFQPLGSLERFDKEFAFAAADFSLS